MLEDALGGLPLRVWVLQGWDILRFASLLLSVSPPLSVHGIDANQSWRVARGVPLRRVADPSCSKMPWVAYPCGRVADPSCSKMPWVAYPCGSGSCKGGTFFTLLLSFSVSLLPLSVHGRVAYPSRSQMPWGAGG